MTNILYGRTDLKMAGPGIVILKTATAMVKRGHKVTVVSSGGTLHEAFVHAGIRSCVVDELAFDRRRLLDLIRAVFATRDVIIANNIEVIHGHNLLSTLIMYLGALISCKKVLVYTTVHGVGKESFFKFAPGKLVAVSKFVQSNLINAGISHSKIKVIYNGFIDLKNTPKTPMLLKQFDYPKGYRLNIISVAMMTKFKGHKRLIEAFSKVLNVHQNIHLTLVGDGDCKSALMKDVERLAISEKVTFAGIRNDVPKLLCDSHLFVHLPDYETFGMVVLEAMAAGLPVVASNVGGIPELIVSGKSGYLVDNNIENIVDKINNILGDQALRKTFGLNARARVSEYFDFCKVVGQYESLYNKL